MSYQLRFGTCWFVFFARWSNPNQLDEGLQSMLISVPPAGSPANPSPRSVWAIIN